MKKVGFVYDDVYLRHHWEDHPEHKGRLLAVKERLQRSPIKEELTFLKPRRATPEEVALNHDPAYVQEVKEFCEAGGGFLDPDTYATPDTYEVALYAVGGLLRGAEELLEGRLDSVFCAVRPPGHHAEYARAMGFCIFNNAAVLARYLLKKGLKRVLIIDFDAHHGNGTQRSFYEEDRVFYFSTHQYPFYPGTGSADERGAGKGYGYTLNVPLPAGAGDEEVLPVYEKLLPEVYESFRPQFVIVSAGYDLHADDPLTHLRVSDEGVRRIARSIVRLSEGLPLLFTLEGGYDLRALSEGVHSTLEEMLWGGEGAGR